MNDTRSLAVSYRNSEWSNSWEWPRVPSGTCLRWWENAVGSAGSNATPLTVSSAHKNPTRQRGPTKDFVTMQRRPVKGGSPSLLEIIQLDSVVVNLLNGRVCYKKTRRTVFSLRDKNIANVIIIIGPLIEFTMCTIRMSYLHIFFSN
ncbi:hypothetical protein GWI33_017803 [Rhynchophorus ferrugineus]|uniref:Uncharacterized protein n=1 Tax=Rhynchophorus ferrugineus TaxID=354439 RepID=A0A834HUQ3_RHYFE|nr:hypothetical protein GWI33_017803 [Rhynchophorus ferrugineus]